MNLRSFFKYGLICLLCFSLLSCQRNINQTPSNKTEQKYPIIGICEAFRDLQPPSLYFELGKDNTAIYYLDNTENSKDHPVAVANKIIAFDTVKQKIKWEYTCDSSMNPYICIINGNALFFKSYYVKYSGEQFIYAVDATTGKERWRYKGIYILSDFAWKDHVLYVSPSLSQIAAIDDQTGKIVWKREKQEISSKDHQKRDVFINSLSISGDRLFVTTDTQDSLIENKLYVLDAKTGNDLWTYPIPAFGNAIEPPIVTEQTIFAVCDNIVYAFSTQSKELLWKYIAPDSIKYNNRENVAILLNQTLMIWNYGFIALDVNSGKVLWTRDDGALNPYSVSTYGAKNGILYFVKENDTSDLQSEEIPVENTCLLEAIQIETGRYIDNWKLVTKEKNLQKGIHFDSNYGLQKLGNDFYFKGYTNTKGDNQMYKADYEFLYRVPVPDINK